MARPPGLVLAQVSIRSTISLSSRCGVSSMTSKGFVSSLVAARSRSASTAVSFPSDVQPINPCPGTCDLAKQRWGTKRLEEVENRPLLFQCHMLRDIHQERRPASLVLAVEDRERTWRKSAGEVVKGLDAGANWPLVRPRTSRRFRHGECRAERHLKKFATIHAIKRTVPKAYLLVPSPP